MAVPDTALGRFDMVVLHVCWSCGGCAAPMRGARWRRGLFDAFCRDMDHNLREMGVSDVGVPRTAPHCRGVLRARACL